MGKVDQNYQVVYREDTLNVYIPGGWVFFQRPESCGGGYWLGRTFDGVFIMELEYPVSLFDGISYLMEVTKMHERGQVFDDDFTLF
ncbi:hypothetical protein [Salmonella enterica]|uniref:hypothetical protein n=1 Tax=Salmonella enterica TaxID=28901 RepID=UPI000FB5A9A7|nr:hypothetical protein [Salmonella enterica subsp. enterica serovar Thompson]EEO5411051.1 hypothetical protein [Salmonella enterica subsp. enterica serovar Thompson]EFV2492881.1 hypothetical protein [Salmonella enterica]MJX35753.1 hypothetical protein [Salmonella enterica subsp. enterica serovar Braenderup]